MKKITFLTFLFSFVFATQANAQLNEGFDTAGLPTGWTETVVADGMELDYNWVSGATLDQSETIAPLNGAGMAIIQSEDSRSGITELSTPSQDLSSFTSPILSFSYSNLSWYGDVDALVIKYKSSSLDSWTVIQTLGNAENWTAVSISLPNPSSDYYVAFEAQGGWGYGITLDDVMIEEAPSCLPPTDVYVDNINTTSADIRWTAPGGSETAFEFKVVPYGDPEPLSGVSVSASVTAVQEAGLMAGSIYDVYVRSVCGGDYTIWSTVVSFATECEVATGAFINDFEDVADITCWALFDGGLGTSSWTYSALDGLWFLPFEADFVSQHDDILFSPSFTVTDNLTDGFQYYVERPDSSWVNRYDILVYAADDLTSSGLLGTLATDFIPDPLGATYEHDLSDYEGTDVRIAFHDYSIADNQDTYAIDDFRVASFASLGIEEASMAQFTYFPNPVNDVLTIKAQKTVEDVTVFNMLGQVVKRQTPYTMDCTVDLSAMQSGAYFVQVSIGNTVETVRVLKK